MMEEELLSWYEPLKKRLEKHNGDAIIIMRHAERHPISDPAQHRHAMLTEKGRESSLELGAWLREEEILPSSCLTSPVQRCWETAKLILEGASLELDIKTIPHLGSITPFIQDVEMAEMTFRLMHMQEICNGLLTGEPVPGFTDMGSGLRPLIEILCTNTEEGIALVVTHDFFIASIAGYALQMSFRGDEWIHFLEPMLLLNDGGRLTAWFRGNEALVP